MTKYDDLAETDEDSVYLMSILLFFGAFFISITLKQFRNTGYLPTAIRNFLSDFAVIIGIFLMNIVCSLLVPAITNSRMRLKYPKKNTPEGSDKTLLEKIYLSYANMFVITRPLDTFSSTSMNAALLIQPVQCLVNIIFIPVYLSFSDVRGDGSHSTLSGFQIMQIDQAVVILILTLVNIILCFTNISCKISCAVCPSRGSEFRQAQISNQNKNQEPVNFTSVELDERGAVIVWDGNCQAQV